jgi:drug/metabolite transporter (DMT)-like permease
MTPATLGLTFAVACSLTNVAMDVSQKKALRRGALLTTIVFVRICVCLLFTVIALGRAHFLHPAPWTVLASHAVLHTPHLVAALIADCGLVALATYFYYRALQVSALAVTVPFLTFTPIFMLAMGSLLLRQTIALPQVEAVAVIVFGSLLAFRTQHRVGWLSPLRALSSEPGSRFMLMASLLLAATNLLERWLVMRLDIFTLAWIYSVGSTLVFSTAWTLQPRPGAGKRHQLQVAPAIFAGVADAATFLLQLASLQYLPAVLTVSFKRSGILVTVLLGRLIFRERQPAVHLLAATVMVAGMLLLYLPRSLLTQTIFVTCILTSGWVVERIFRRSTSLPTG